MSFPRVRRFDNLKVLCEGVLRTFFLGLGYEPLRVTSKFPYLELSLRVMSKTLFESRLQTDLGNLTQNRFMFGPSS